MNTKIEELKDIKLIKNVYCSYTKGFCRYLKEVSDNSKRMSEEISSLKQELSNTEHLLFACEQQFSNSVSKNLKHYRGSDGWCFTHLMFCAVDKSEVKK